MQQNKNRHSRHFTLINNKIGTVVHFQEEKKFY